MTTDSIIVESPSKVHFELNFNAVSRVFDQEFDHAELRGNTVCNPFDVCVMETGRDLDNLRKSPGYATDVVLFVKGEPEDPTCTKVGGQPFWPQDQEWPTSEDGSPQKFLAQFNFADSGDILGPGLPAELLVVTVDESPWVDDHLSFHWVLADDTPNSDLTVPSVVGISESFYGVLHRTADYRGDIVHGTKIGGRPRYIQTEMRFSGRFLCQLGGFNAMVDLDLHPETLRGDTSPSSSVSFGDLGLYHMFITEDDKVYSSFDTY